MVLQQRQNEFVWFNGTLDQKALDALGWEEITAATHSVVSQTGSGTIYISNAGSLILLPTNSSKSRNLTAEILQEARLERMDAARAKIEARTNAQRHYWRAG